jgi:hypothetical protein
VLSALRDPEEIEQDADIVMLAPGPGYASLKIMTCAILPRCWCANTAAAR